jgi:hypothetical protein
MKRRYYIAYGSNLNVRQMAMRCPTARLVGTGVLEDYELQFKGAPYGAFATIGRKAGTAVPVAVWSLRPGDERSLDSYEGYPSHYFKKDLPVSMDDGSELTAMVYIMNQRMGFGVPDQRYYNTVYEGYENCGLDINILNQAVDESIALHRQRETEQANAASKYTWAEDEFEGEEADFEEDPAEEPDEDDPFQMHL